MNLFNKIRPISILIATIAIMMSGCVSTQPMALNKSTKAVDVSAKSVVLMTLDIHRTTPSRYVPNPHWITIVKQPDGTNKAEAQNFNLSDSDTTTSKDGHKIYFISMALAPGQYKLNTIFGDANAFPFISNFYLALLMDVQVQKNAVTYIGRINAELRPRQGKEFRAGPVLPLIDQAVAGISSGSFDVAVTDFSQEDMAYFKSTYPALSNVTISTTLLPPFDRAKVQHWWDGDTQDSAKQEPPASKPAQPIEVAQKAH